MLESRRDSHTPDVRDYQAPCEDVSYFVAIIIGFVY